MGKGGNAGNQLSLLFPHCFLPVLKTNFSFSATFDMSSANTLNLNQSKILSFGKELKHSFLEKMAFKLTHYQMDNILDQTKLKAFADNKLNVTKMIISVFDTVENIVGKGEIACTSNFSFSHNVFKRLLFQMRQRVSLSGNGLNTFL